MGTPKFAARDCELSTTGVGADGQPIDPWTVTSMVLEQVPAVFESRGGRVWTRNAHATRYAMDCCRNWTSAATCLYSDMSHVEACGAPTLRPRMFAAQSISALLVAEEARQLAEANADDDVKLSLTAANADVLDPSVSWGTHANFCSSTELWEDLFLSHRHPARLAYVSSAIAASIAFFGCGYLLPLKEGTIFSLSARAHHLSSVHTLSTTEAFRRGLLNTRREPHGNDHDRLHLIGFDYSIAGAALMCSFVQCLLAAAEEGYCGMILYDPVRALRIWSWNLDLKTGRLPGEATLIDGRSLTLPAYVRELAKRLLEMCEGRLITPQVAPEATDLLPRIIELTHYAEEGSLNHCAKHLDWAAKLMCLLGGGRSFTDAASRLADHDFSNTNPRRGAIWRLWQEGMIDPLIDRADAEDALLNPPAESRGWARGKLIDRFADQISDVDWSYVELRRDASFWGPRLRVEMPHMDSLNRAQFEPVLDRARDVSHLEQLLEEGQCGDSDPLDNVTGNLATPSGN